MQAALIFLVLLVLVLSLATPLYSLVTLARALTQSSPYSAWPPVLILLIWLGQWPFLFILSFTLPGGGFCLRISRHAALLSCRILASQRQALRCACKYMIYKEKIDFTD